jgi:spermidine synthase
VGATLHDGRMKRRLLLGLAFVSGANALIYESLWFRSFGVVFGNTTDAVATVLAVFMGGLGLGSHLAGRRRASSPLRAYALVEMAIGATAALSLPLLRALPGADAAVARALGAGGAIEAVGRFALAALVLLPPTILLGTTVPLVVEFLARSGSGLRRSLGDVYFWNTLGGAVGVPLGTFLLVPSFGVSASMMAAAGASFAIGAVAWRWGTGEAAAQPAAVEASRLPPLFVAVATITGAFTFGVEVLWTRSYALVIGSTAYAFSLILLAALLGLVAGTGLYTRFRTRVKHPQAALGSLLAVTGLVTLLGVVVIGQMPGAYLLTMRVLPVTFMAHQIAALSLCVLTMLPVTTCLGFTFPLIVHLLHESGGHSAQSVTGRLYAWNTAGAVAGAAITGVLLVPRAGIEGSYLLLAGLVLATAAWTLAGAASWRIALRGSAAAATAVVVLALVPVWRPWNPLVMTSGVHRYGLTWAANADFQLRDLAKQRRLLFYREGKEAVVAVFEGLQSGKRFLSINGKTDAGGSSEDALQQRFIAHVPLLLHPSPKRVLVVGWGSGATAQSASLYPVETLECVEIEPATWEAAPFFESLSGRVRSDPRFHMRFADGRNYLLRSTRRWDVVVAEPSNAWLAGVANLFTKEYYETVRSRLAPGGVFGQWFHYYDMDLADLKVELATFASVFPSVSVWMVPPLPPEAGGTISADLVLVGSEEPVALDWPRLQHAFEWTLVGSDLRDTQAVPNELALAASYAFGEADMARFVRDDALFPEGTPLNTDDNPWIEFHAARHTVSPTADVVRTAQSLHAELGDAAEDPIPPMTGHPGLAAGGHDAAEVYAGFAERWTATGLPRRAHRALALALALDPECEDVLAGLAAEAEGAGDWARAGQLLSDLARRRPHDPDVLKHLCAALVRQARWTEARDILLRARAADPGQPVDPALLQYVDAQIAAARTANTGLAR